MSAATPEAGAQPVRLAAGDALVVVDLQRDFLPGGALAVPDGDAVVAPLNRYLALFHAAGLPSFASRCWHPPEHCSFQAQGGEWPEHCVAGSEGAGFAAGLELPAEIGIISKATSAERDAYSAFQETPLADRLRELGAQRLLVGGLATDYCVRCTVLDGLELGFEVLLLGDAIRAVERRPGDGERAVREMLDAGARPLTLAHLQAA